MGALTTLPTSRPLTGVTWIARQIGNAATQELLDPMRIETALVALGRCLEGGKTDEDVAEAEHRLEELADITVLRAKAAEGSDEAESETLPLQPVLSVMAADPAQRSA